MSWEPLNLASPDFQVASEAPFLGGVLYAGKRHMLSGPPEALKTLVALALGLELQRARPDNTFALIDFENGPWTTRLMLDELGASSEEVARVWYVETTTPPDEDDVRTLVDAGVLLTIIDASAGAFAATGLDDHKRADAERFGIEWIDPLWHQAIATLLLDHVTKSSETRGKFAIGSERKHGRTDVHLGAEVIHALTRGGEGRIKLLTHKDRPGHLLRPVAAEIQITSDVDTHALTWRFEGPASSFDATGTWRPTQLMERVSRYLETQPEPVSCNTIVAEVIGRREYLLQAVAALVADAHAIEQNGPRGSKLISFVSPYAVPVPDQFLGDLGNQSQEPLISLVPSLSPPKGEREDYKLASKLGGDRHFTEAVPGFEYVPGHLADDIRRELEERE